MIDEIRVWEIDLLVKEEYMYMLKGMVVLSG